MPSGLDVSVIIPTIDECETLGLLHPRLQRGLQGYRAEVIVVDDGSKDGTRERVGQLAGEFPYRLLPRDHVRGLASAVVDGLALAGGRVLVVMDADGSHPPEILPELIGPIDQGRAEFVLASRHAPGGTAPGLIGARRTISWGAAMLARPLVRVGDPMSGYFAVSRPVVGRAPLAPVGYKIALEILVKCRPSPVLEVPFEFGPRAAGESKMRGAQMRGYVRHVARLYRWRWFGPGRASSTR